MEIPTYSFNSVYERIVSVELINKLNIYTITHRSPLRLCAVGRPVPLPPCRTCVGLAFSFGKLMLVDFSCSVDGLHGVGGSRRPRRATNTG